MKELIEQLYDTQSLSGEQLRRLLLNYDDALSAFLFEKAQKVQKQYFGNKIYTRGLIEFTNYCKNDCYYCGIRKSNLNASRYRLSKEDILSCCAAGYELGFRTFVLQGGEDGAFSDADFVDLITAIKKQHPDCALTLSIGERSYESCQKFFDAGADRYLLRHETANKEHYEKLHPSQLSLQNRKQCLYNLKEIGYQVGTGFMVGSPYQTIDHLVEDLLFIKELKPQMIGIGPFIPHADTPFGKEQKGTLELTLFLIGLLRLMNPNALIPATTALGTIDPKGREKGILAGANVVMPNLSPVSVRKKYALYDDKICTGEEAAECRVCLQNRMKNIGYELVVDRGDFISV
ncbi:[FeFe] hydrogenase H-cluster radical SAM maturase HydE [Oscillospiraceae bacterium PP1C4]